MSRDRDTFGARDIYLGQTVEAPSLEQEDQALGRMYRQRALIPPRAGGKRRKWKKLRARAIDVMRVNPDRDPFGGQG